MFSNYLYRIKLEEDNVFKNILSKLKLELVVSV